MAIKLSMAPIAWSNDDLPELGGDTPLEQILRQSKAAGFSGTELGGRYPQEKQALKDLLDTHGMQLSSGWFSGNLLASDYEQERASLDAEIEKRKFVDSNIIVYCECSNTIQTQQHTPLSEKPVSTDDEMKAFAAAYSQLSKHASQQGMTLAYHFHMGTIIQTADELDKFLHYADDNVRITFDTGHMYFAGGDVLKELEKHYSQIALVHFKDVRNKVMKQVYDDNMSFLDAVLAGVYTMPGDGDIDFEPIVKFLKENNYAGWIVVEAEQDPSKAEPFTYARNSYKYMMNLFNQYKIEVIA